MTLIESLKANGKARRTNWVYGAFAYLIKNKMVFNTGVVVELDLPTHDIFANDWQPYKEPCKHEPIVYVELKNVGTWFRQNMTHYRADPLMITCKHCGVKIKAEKWTEA